MSIPNYVTALANQQGPATVVASGMTIPVKIMDIEHESGLGRGDETTFKCMVVNPENILREPRFPVSAMDEYVRSCLAASAARRSYRKPNTLEQGIRIHEMAIVKVIFNKPATIVIWGDGTKTVVKCQEGDVYSKEAGLALCIAKKALGNKGNFNDIFHKWIPEE